LDLVIEVSALEAAPDAALNTVAERSSTVERAFDGIGISSESRTTSGVWVGEEQDWEHERRVFRGYRARARYLVRLSDASLLGRLMKEVTRDGMARVEGPWWKVDSENQAHVEACRRAAEDARRKAEAYAQSMGLRLGQIVRAKEPSVGVRFGYAALSAGGGHEEPEMMIHPGSLDVEAVLDVTFHLEQG
jgi:hypothetical protein